MATLRRPDIRADLVEGPMRQLVRQIRDWMQEGARVVSAQGLAEAFEFTLDTVSNSKHVIAVPMSNRNAAEIAIATIAGTCDVKVEKGSGGTAITWDDGAGGSTATLGASTTALQRAVVGERDIASGTVLVLDITNSAGGPQGLGVTIRTV